MRAAYITITVNSRKYDGSIRRSWNAGLVRYEPPLIELIGKFDFDVEHSALGHLKRDTVSHEYFWLDRWYNIFNFYEPSGEFRNYYLNLTMPPTFGDGVLDYVDLDIDILVWPDGRFDVLDVEDFDANAREFGYPDDVKHKIDLELETLLAMIRRDELSRLDPQNIAADRKVQAT